MADKTTNSKLFTEFQPISTKEWEEVILQDLKGADYDKKLVWKPLEGFGVRPYYRAEDLQGIGFINATPGKFPFVRGNEKEGNNWLIRQDFDTSDSVAANQSALKALAQGVDSIGFETCKNCEPSVDGLEKLLTGFDFSKTEVNFVSGCGSRKILPVLVEYLNKSNQKSEKANGSFNYSPLNNLVLNGQFSVDEETARQRVFEHFNNGQKLPRFKLFEIGGHIFHNSGASAVQELAFSLSMGAEYLQWLSDKGISIDESAQNLRFTFGIGPNYFMEIAKFRAARLLWAKLVEAYKPSDLKSAQISIHAVTGMFNLTIYDPYVNMLRTSTEAMSAVLGGVHSLTVLPFDAPYQKPSPFSERIARNQQQLLKEEAYLSKVADPSAGSYYIEMLTASIAEHAWNLFLKVDEMGGFVAAFSKSFIQNEIKNVAQKKLTNISSRRETVLGTNQYPNFGEVANTSIIREEHVTFPASPQGTLAEPLVPFRAAQQIEGVRYRTDASGKRPKVFMLTIGGLAFRRARAQFSCNFFACAGFEVIDNIGFKSVDEGVKAALEAKADMVVICSSDDEYSTYAPEAFDKIGNRSLFVVAGEPACKPELEAKGIKNYISVKSNLLETLKQYQQMLNIG